MGGKQREREQKGGPLYSVFDKIHPMFSFLNESFGLLTFDCRRINSF